MKPLERFPRRAKELRSVGDHLYKLDIHKSMGLGRMHRGCREGWPTSLQSHTLRSLAGHGVQGKSQLTGKGQILHPSTKRAKRKIWEITDESASLESLEELWNGSSWKLFPGMKEKATGRSQHLPQLTQPSPTVQQFIVCFVIASIETWEADLTHEDQGKKGMKENLQVSLCHL